MPIPMLEMLKEDFSELGFSNYTVLIPQGRLIKGFERKRWRVRRDLNLVDPFRGSRPSGLPRQVKSFGLRFCPPLYLFRALLMPG